MFNKAASEAFCSKIVLSSDTGTFSTTSDEGAVDAGAVDAGVSVADSLRVSTTSLESCSFNAAGSEATAGVFTTADVATSSFPNSSA